MDKQRFIAPSLFTLAIVTNYALHKADRPTLCSGTLRPVLHTETTVGKLLTVGIWSGLTLWIIPHLLIEKNQNHLTR